ncbi:S10 family peptidase [Chitinophaga tropicalis]|uniref:Carboxypeptidase n=1 Tax=Chitinophaga tropicalis TaxID=2683588 RepID=A0A7K1U6I6_9BACT|nr:carboxypeptidase [Chitinophaga tropicalis]MVT09967.1 carboxypeptidase [Chitinophaga tropicalis]
MIRNILFPLAFSCLVASQLSAQTKEAPAKYEGKPSPSRILAVDSAVTTRHEVTIKGQRIPYLATAGSIPVWDDEGKPLAGVFYTYYEREDVKDKSGRPLVISFNGGPGTPSVWMEIGYTGPRILNIDDEGYPVQPFGMRDNPHSILDVADIVYVDPVSTGYSRPVSKDIPGSKFFGVNADIKYLAEWINTFVTRKGRWASPKFLIGESYGTTRVSGLALELQDQQWMYLNGVILVSPTELGIERNGPLDAALRLPYYAATAWYHKKLPADLQGKDLNDVLPEVENFTLNELIPALARGGALDAAQRKSIGARIARYSGIKESVVQENNLDVSTNLFWKELLRDEGFTVGRLDSRYRGIDRKTGGIEPDYNPELTAWLQAFTPAIQIYLRDELNYKTDIKYNMFGNVWPWDQKDNKTGENLRQAIAQNPFLHLLVQSGYYDGACDYFNARYSMWQLDPGGRLKDRLKWEGYRSGHMMYLRKDDLAAANDNLRKFILGAIPAKGAPAKY